MGVFSPLSTFEGGHELFGHQPFGLRTNKRWIFVLFFLAWFTVQNKLTCAHAMLLYLYKTNFRFGEKAKARKKKHIKLLKPCERPGVLPGHPVSRQKMSFSVTFSKVNNRKSLGHRPVNPFLSHRVSPVSRQFSLAYVPFLSWIFTPWAYSKWTPWGDIYIFSEVLSWPTKVQQQPKGPLNEGPSTQESHPHHGRVLHHWSNHQDQALQDRGTHSNRNIHMFLATIADGKTADSWKKGRKIAEG